MNCISCCEDKKTLIFYPLYGFLCSDCYQEILKDK